jgi:hypothetical protein
MGILGRGPVDRTDRRVFPCVARSGSLVFSAPSSALTVTGLALEGFRSSPCLADPERPTWADPAHFISPSELCTHRPGRAPDTLAGSSETTSSRGIRRGSCRPCDRRLPLTPPSTCSRASTPAAGIAAFRFGSEVPTSEIAFRPRGFSPPRRLSPLGGRGLVSSLCRPWGSLRFARSGCPKAGRRGSRSVESYPSKIDLFRSRTVSPPPLPPCRFDGSEALLREERPNRSSPALRWRCPIRFFLGFGPLQGPWCAASRLSTGNRSLARFDPHVAVMAASQVCPASVVAGVDSRRPSWGF